ncbi:MAG: Gfo/Idh/MocA family oxidoreductase [Candidatus Sumerlaeota bacterium]|nr:Gfo/Idh/MocA family oxidoreductase [Candidatus Sumerlaeota bacterium]
MAKAKARPKPRPIRLGILGLGRAGFRMQCREIADKQEMFEVVAGCDIYEPYRRRMAERFPACAIYRNLRDLLADPHVELVSVATRSLDHAKHAIMALKAGKHVLLEKPIATTYADAKKLMAAAKKAKGGLFIRHSRRFDPEFLHVREIIASGILGEIKEIKLARIGYQRRDDWQTMAKYGGGQLLNNGPHPIDQGLQFLGAPKKPLKDIWGSLQLVSSVGDAEDHAKIVLRGADGAVVDIEVGNGSAVGVPDVVIWGTKGGLLVQGKTITVRYINPKRKLPPRPLNEGSPGDTFGSKEELPWIEKSFPIQPKTRPNIWDELYKAIRLRKRFPIALEEALEVMRVISEVKRIARYKPAKLAARARK